MLSDLATLSELNVLCKYADDTDLIVPEKSDVSLEDEFANVCSWAKHNKMIINWSKTKELVFHKPNPRLSITPKSIPGIEQVLSAKLLGVNFRNNFKFDDHIKEIISICCQRFYLLKQIKNQGLCLQKLDVIFQALIVSKITYGLSAWGGFLTVHLKNKINSLFKKAHRYNFTSKIFTIDELLLQCDSTLFKKSQLPHHCLNQLLPPPPQSTSYNLRERGHDIMLTCVTSQLFKKSFINRTLFQFK